MRWSPAQTGEVRNQIWLLEPDAAPEDGWWQGRPIWQVAVAAPSAAFARLEAERWARRRLPRHHVGNESPSLSAGFIDQRLYRARELAEAEGPRPEDFHGASVLVLAGPMASFAAS
jgi:hypothetical protein